MHTNVLPPISFLIFLFLSLSPVFSRHRRGTGDSFPFVTASHKVTAFFLLISNGFFFSAVVRSDQSLNYLSVTDGELINFYWSGCVWFGRVFSHRWGCATVICRHVELLSCDLFSFSASSISQLDNNVVDFCVFIVCCCSACLFFCWREQSTFPKWEWDRTEEREPQTRRVFVSIQFAVGAWFLEFACNSQS